MNTFTKGGLTAVITASVLALSACGTTSSNTASTPSSTSTTQTSAPSSTAGMPMPAAPAGPHNQADITFAQDMTAHHQGAIEMADLAPTRASSTEVKALAARIKAAQAPEITEMAGWLAAWAPDTDMNGMPIKTTASDMAGMNHGSSSAAMPGMMSSQQMDELSAATGSAFDKMFLQMMTVHHQGALEMAKTEKAQGSNPAALKLADSIITSQTAEIATMADLLKGL